MAGGGTGSVGGAGGAGAGTETRGDGGAGDEHAVTAGMTAKVTVAK